MSADCRPASTRRDVVALGIGAFIVSLVPVAARRGPTVTRRSMPVMGTIAELVVVGVPAARAEEALDAAMKELTGVEAAMSRFRDDSDIGRANIGAAARPVSVREATATVVREALAWASLTGGAFDPAIGRMVGLWDVTHRAAPPPPAALRELAGRGLWRDVEVGTERGTPVLSYANADVRLDLGGIAKGWAVDRATDALRALGVTRALVNVGGDLAALGTSADGGPWQVGIRDPNDSRSLMTTVEASDCAIATSGDYEQFFRWRGERFHHLMDPATAAPVRSHRRSVTVRAARCVDSDAAATAAFAHREGDLAPILARRDALLIHAA